MRFLGMLLLILSCGGLGASRVLELKRDIKVSEELLRALDRMEIEICGKHRTLPETAALLHLEFPRCFEGLGDISDAIRDRSFGEIWQEHFHTCGLAEETEKAMCVLGADLSAGMRPETAFENCRRDLKAACRTRMEALERNGRVYIVSGFAAGLLLMIAIL